MNTLKALWAKTVAAWTALTPHTQTLIIGAVGGSIVTLVIQWLL